jgi:hypothetical protein
VRNDDHVYGALQKLSHALLTDFFLVPQVLVILATDFQNELLAFTESGFKDSQEGCADFMCNLVETEEHISLDIAPLRP